MKLKAYLSLIRWNKPIGTLLLLWPTLDSLFIASKGKPQFITIVVFILGVFLTRSAGCAINDCADSEFDKNVLRTKNRPVASGTIGRKEALLVAAVLCVVAFAITLVFLKTTTLLMSIPALLLFILYPFMKRFFAYPQFILGIAFSFGILMAFIETTGCITYSGVWLFLANLFWVFGYDTIYAMVDKQDDLKIGIKTSAISLGTSVVKAVAMSYALFIFLMVLVGIINGFQDLYWLCLLFAALLLGIQIHVLYDKKEAKYFNMFLLNNWVGIIIFIGILLNFYMGSHEIIGL